MHIQWFGQTCFKIQTKINGEDVVVISDPIAKESGLKLSKMKGDIVTLSDYTHKNLNGSSVSGATDADPFMIIGAGEYETKRLFITGVDTSIVKEETREHFNVTYRYDLEGMRIVHLGMNVSKKLTEDQIEALGLIDVLLLPVGGGKHSYNYEQAAKMVNILEPRIVIPMYYHVDGSKEKLDDVVKFAKELGVNDITPEKKAIIKKSDLPQDDMQVIILENA